MEPRSDDPLARQIQLACLLEATARKPGNVHPGASFANLLYDDFVRSAKVAAPILAKAGEIGVGRAVCEAVDATQVTVGTNTNLGICLLIAPLAAVPAKVRLADGIGDVLQRLTNDDAKQVYRAIRRANAGGMGSVPDEDVSQEPRGTLVEVMRLAAGRDRVAAQYANGFCDVLEIGVPLLAKQAARFPQEWETEVIRLHLELMARFSDSLIARKCGEDEARVSASKAQNVLDAGWPETEAGRQALAELDNWLRQEENRRNPGTTADLVTAALFAALRERVVPECEEVVESRKEERR